MQKRDFSQMLASFSLEFTPVIDTVFEVSDYVPVDLSIGNSELDKMDIASAESVGDYIDKHLSMNGAKVAYGGYLEKRSLYTRSKHFTVSNAEPRNIHLGMDIWCPEGTTVLAPLNGVVHSFKDNRNYGDYGPCVILEHTMNDQKFYTLYGHLSRESIQNMTEGSLISKGEKLASLGTVAENGDYAPHLHFQIIKDIEGFEGDYPGVCSASRLDHYRLNCPDPNLLLKMK